MTDATWYHFININLVGDHGDFVQDPSDPKWLGFLKTASGQAHLEKIKNYYLNIAQWIAPPERRRCMRMRALWYTTWNDRLLEAVTLGIPLTLGEYSLRELVAVGGHARDVLRRIATQCQTTSWLIDWLRPHLAKPWGDVIDPWAMPTHDTLGITSGIANPAAVLDVALGAIVVALRAKYRNDRLAADDMTNGNVQAQFSDIVADAVQYATRITNDAMNMDQQMMAAMLTP